MTPESPESHEELDLWEWTHDIWKPEKATPESREDVFNGLPSDSCWD